MINIKDSSDNVSQAIAITEDNMLVIFYNGLNYNTQYVVTMPKEAVVNHQGGNLNSDYKLNFATGAEYTRMAGKNRYDTSVEISKAGWSASDYVVLATGRNFADALSGSAMARVLSAPIILV